jgi:site-specific DNA-methyltransferase (adenine-specific)
VLDVKEIDINNLQPWEDNPRQNDHAVVAVAESITRFGFNVPILCDQNLTIIAGHTRWKAAKKLDLTTVPVIIIEMTSEKRRAFAIADNKLAELADWDMPKLRDALETLRLEDVDLKELGFSDEELRRFLSSESTDEDSIPEVLDTTSTIQKGDLYSLGNHRLLCGDSRKIESVEFLLGGCLAHHVFGGLQPKNVFTMGKL